MTLKKLLELLRWIDFIYASVKHVNQVNMHGSHIYCTGGGELSIVFNTQPPKTLDQLLKRKGFIVWQGEYIYRPRTRK